MRRIGRPSTFSGALSSSPLASTNSTSNLYAGGLTSAHQEGTRSSQLLIRLSLYQQPPTHKLSLEDFEKLAVARLHLLCLLDICSLKSLREDVTLAELEKIQAKHLPLHVNESAMAFDVETERRNDVASHFILRLAMADSPDNIRWFIQKEVSLLK